MKVSVYIVNQLYSANGRQISSLLSDANNATPLPALLIDFWNRLLSLLGRGLFVVIVEESASLISAHLMARVRQRKI